MKKCGFWAFWKSIEEKYTVLKYLHQLCNLKKVKRFEGYNGIKRIKIHNERNTCLRQKQKEITTSADVVNCKHILEFKEIFFKKTQPSIFYLSRLCKLGFKGFFWTHQTLALLVNNLAAKGLDWFLTTQIILSYRKTIKMAKFQNMSVYSLLKHVINQYVMIYEYIGLYFQKLVYL